MLQVKNSSYAYEKCPERNGTSVSITTCFCCEHCLSNAERVTYNEICRKKL